MGGLCPGQDQEDPADAKQEAQTSANVAPDQSSQAGGNASTAAPEAKSDAADPAEQKEEAPSGGGSSERVVTRKEIRSLSDAEAKRFFDAVDKMLENKSGPGTSEFFRCASYHGQPAPIYCQHGRETFPGWHRIYLMDFEKALQAADIALGNDGNIALHYWDWTQKPQDGLPKIVRDRFSEWPEDFWPPSLQNESRTQRLIRASDGQITSQLASWGVAGDAENCLLATQHWAHASTRFSGNFPSIETPHNSIHVIVGGNGGQMGSVAWAAYDIAFWLHHCNVDRIYESYLELEPDSAMEFENFQDTQANDMWDTTFEPFTKPDGGKYTAKDTFDTRALGFVYDSLFKPPPQNQLREPPTFILFPQVKVYEFESKCYQIHAFIVDGEKEDEFKGPETIDDIDYFSPNYCGGAGIFGRGMECQNCVNRPPQDIGIDITRNLRELGINRYKVKAKIYILETTEDSPQLLQVSDTPLPEPIITGPLFANKDGDELLDQEDKATNDEKEVEALQRYLQKYGYYAPERKVDGDYGDYTKQAVTDYQEATGKLKVDGIAGPKTRSEMLSVKRCDNIDPFAKNEVVDDRVNYEETTYYKKKEIKYYIAVQPGYLARDKTEEAIAKACKQYDDASSLSITKVDEEKEADIKFSWLMFNREDDPTRFDGVGGSLGRGGNGYVEFDLAERWTYGLDGDKEQISDIFDKETWYRGQPTISLYYTALHELGHCFGLVHSVRADDVMSPWYNPAQTALTENDIAELRKIVDKE